MHFIIQKQLRI